MYFGFGVLHLAPTAFWAMTPRELLAAAGRGDVGASGVMSRRDLRHLMTEFPDNCSESEATHGSR